MQYVVCSGPIAHLKNLLHGQRTIPVFVDEQRGPRRRRGQIVNDFAGDSTWYVQNVAHRVAQCYEAAVYSLDAARRRLWNSEARRQRYAAVARRREAALWLLHAAKVGCLEFEHAPPPLGC